LRLTFGVFRWGKRCLLPLLLSMLILPGLRAQAEEEEPPEQEPAKIKVRGYGLFGNRELKSTLELLSPGEDLPPLLPTSFVEDAVLVLFSRLEKDGFLNPAIDVTVTDI